MHGGAGERGQATVELVGVLPLVVVLGFAVWQAAVAGQALWLAGTAARVAARANAIGADPAIAARGVLPPRLEDGLRVSSRDDGGVRVTVRIPAVIGGGAMGSTTAGARFAPQGA
jgi:type IV secretory pathway TrbD component